MQQHPYKMWKAKGNYMFPIFNSKFKVPFHSMQYQSLPRIYEQNASLEIAWTRVLKKKNPSISGKESPFFQKIFKGLILIDLKILNC